MTMKFAPNHYESLKACIIKALELVNTTIIKAEELSKSMGESETRFLWNLFWASKWSTTHRNEYNEGNYLDAHIQTAVKKIVAELKKESAVPAI